jgi:polar amino acid transport system substrate-binding protein
MKGRITSRRLLGAVIAATAALAVAACGGSSSGGGSSTGGTSAAAGGSSSGSGKTYVVATSADFPPMSFRSTENASQVVGFEVDMLKSLMGHLGWKYKVVTSDFNGLIPSVQSGRVDMVVSDVYNTAERQKVVDFVDYLENSFAVMVSGKNKAKVHSYMDVCGQSLGVLTGSAPELEIAQQASKQCTSAGKKKITIRSYPAVSQELPQIANGHLFAILEEFTSLAYTQKKTNGKFAVAFPDPNTTKVGIVVKQNSPLEAKLRSAMQWYLTSPDYKQQAQKWGIQPKSLLANAS